MPNSDAHASTTGHLFAPRATRAKKVQSFMFWWFRLSTYFIIAAASILFLVIFYEGSLTVFQPEPPFINVSFLTDKPQTLYVFEWRADEFSEDQRRAVEDVEAAIRAEIPEREAYYEKAIREAEREEGQTREKLEVVTDELNTVKKALDALAGKQEALSDDLEKLHKKLLKLRRRDPAHPQLAGIRATISEELEERERMAEEREALEAERSTFLARRSELEGSLPNNLRKERRRVLDNLQASLEWPEEGFFAERDAEVAEVEEKYNARIERIRTKYERRIAKADDMEKTSELEERMTFKVSRLEEIRDAKVRKAGSIEAGDVAYRGIYKRKVEAAGVDVETFSYSGGGIFPAIVGTILLTVGSMAIALTLGILSAVFLSEYAKPGTFLNLIRLSILNLAGVPSIVFGLFGLGMFVLFFDWNVSLMAGCFTLAFMVLPVIITASEESLRSIPQGFREGSLALGATKWTSIRTNVLPYALPGILTSSVLGVARVAGETAPIMFTAAYAMRDNLPWEGLEGPSDFFFQGVMALPYHIYVVSSKIPQNEYTERMQYGAAFVFLLIVASIALTSILLRIRMRKRYKW